MHHYAVFTRENLALALWEAWEAWEGLEDKTVRPVRNYFSTAKSSHKAPPYHIAYLQSSCALVGTSAISCEAASGQSIVANRK